MAKQTASAVPSTDKAATQEIDLSNDAFYKLLEAGEKPMCKTWLSKNAGKTVEDFYNLRQLAKSKAKTTPTSGIRSHDGTFVTGMTREETKKLHEVANQLAREAGNG